MKNNTLKKILPHFIAIMIFLLVAVIFCKPALETGVVMQQSDITQTSGMTHQSKLYKEAHGIYPLWVTSMFGGMPAYNIIYEGAWSPLSIVDSAFKLWLPKPLNFFFLSCICFYFLCICLRLRPYVGVLGGLAFAYSSYNPIIAAAGHDTKLLALAYAPALIGAIILLFDKRYISGFVFTTLFATMHLIQNHPQINYYTLIILVIMTIFYAVKWIKEKDIKHVAKAISLALVAAMIGVMINAILLVPVFDYAKYSKRGGQLVMDNNDTNQKTATDKHKTNGLSREYAFQWSYGRAEALSLLFPGITGYGSQFSQRDEEYNIFPKLSEKSNVSVYLRDKLNIPEDQASSIATNLSGSIYWGDKPFTVGSNYFGASICFLFILGLVVLDNKHKWWILTASIFGIILAMGKNLPEINNFLFEYMPLYNKFRTPEMSLVIPQILFPLMAVLAVQKVLDNDDVFALKKLRLSTLIMAAVFIITGLLYINFDYSKENKERTAAVNSAYAIPDSSINIKMQAINQKYEGMVDNKIYENFLQQSKGDTKIAKAVVEALRRDRQSFFGTDILHSLLFVGLTVILLGLFIYKKINSLAVMIGLILLTLLDLIPFDAHYINDKNFDNAEKYHTDQFQETEADKQILKDKDPNYRVLNFAGGDPFQEAKTSYYHKSIGGYHPAKLGIFDDLITYQMSGQPNAAVLNMLNVKYFIQQNQQGVAMAIQNPGALGNCWFVKGVKFVNGPVEEMKGLNNFNPSDTAVIDNSYKKILTGFSPADSSASIKQVAFDNMNIKYESNSNTINVAVFSEIFYKDWNAYIDGKKIPIAKANYVLRALLVPAGKHTIEYKLEPTVFNYSYTVSKFSSWLLIILLVAYLVYFFKQNMQPIKP